MAASVTVGTSGDGMVTWSYPDTDTSMTHSHTQWLHPTIHLPQKVEMLHNLCPKFSIFEFRVALIYVHNISFIVIRLKLVMKN